MSESPYFLAVQPEELTCLGKTQVVRSLADAMSLTAVACGESYTLIGADGLPAGVRVATCARCEYRNWLRTL